MHHNTVAVGGQPFPPELPCAVILPADGETHNFCYGQTNRRTDRQMDRQTGEQDNVFSQADALTKKGILLV